MPKRSPGSRSADDINKKFGARLRDIRERTGRSQTDVGKALGVSFQQIQKYENGTTSISLDRLNQLADFFAVSVGQLVDRLGLSHALRGAQGFAEDSQAVYDGEAAPTNGALLSKDSEALLAAFNRIRSRKLRRSILAVVEGYEESDKPEGADQAE